MNTCVAIDSIRLKDAGLKLKQDYLLEIPSYWMAADIGGEDWNQQVVQIAGTNDQSSFWVMLSLDGIEGLFAAEPSWLRQTCSCEIITLMNRGCLCGGADPAV